MTRKLPTEDGFYWVATPVSEIGTANHKAGYVEWWTNAIGMGQPSIVQIETQNGMRMIKFMGWDVDEQLLNEGEYWWSEKLTPPALPDEELIARVNIYKVIGIPWNGIKLE